MTLEATRGEGAQATVAFQHLRALPADPFDGEGGEAGETPEMVTAQILEVHLSASKDTTASAPVVSVGFHVSTPRLLE